jgi:NADPH:quinone reductase-like Zn-dependent oxidoreductase
MKCAAKGAMKMDTMMALRAHTRGGTDVLEYERAPIPSLASDQVMVEVHAAAITFAELTWEETWQDADGNDRTPTIPAHEVSGVVTAVGEDTNRLKVGDEVYGRITFSINGAAAEYVAVPESDLALRPLSVGHVESAALPLAALTAWQALFDHGKLQPGEHVLVLGGSGGVGVYAVQLANLFGASVSATARGSDLDLVIKLGAELAIDYANATDQNVLEPADVVIDTVGGATFTRALDLVKPGGRLVTIVAPPSPEQIADRDLTASFFVVEASPDDLSKIAALVDDEKIAPIVAAVYDLADGKRAFEEGPQLHKPGKTVLRVHS